METTAMLSKCGTVVFGKVFHLEMRTAGGVLGKWLSIWRSLDMMEIGEYLAKAVENESTSKEIKREYRIVYRSGNY